MADPPNPPPVIRAPSRTRRQAGVDGDVEFGAGHLVVVLEGPMRCGEQIANVGDVSCAEQFDGARHPVVLGDHMPDPAAAARHRRACPTPPADSSSVRSRKEATPRMSTAFSQEARRRAYSPSANECATLVSMTSTVRSSAGRIERDVLHRVRPGVEQQHRAGLCCGGGGLIHRTARHSDEVVLGLLGTAWRSPTGPGSIPERAETARVVTHSTAAEDDRPAPEGTWESRARSNPPMR